MEGFAQGVSQRVHIFYDVTVFGDRHHDPRNIHLLEGIFSQERPAHVGGYSDQGYGIHVRGGDPGDQVRGPRAGCGQADPYFAGGTGIAVRRVGRALFVGGQDMMYLIFILVQGIVYIQDRAARIPKNRIYPLLFEAFDHYLRTCKLHVISPPVSI